MFGGYLGGFKEDAMIAFPYAQNAVSKILKSAQGKRWKRLGNPTHIPNATKKRIAFLNGWCYFSVFETIYKTKDFITFTEVVPSIPVPTYTSRFIEHSFITTYGINLYFVMGTQANSGGNWSAEVYRSTNEGDTWDRVLSVGYADSSHGASRQYDLLFSSNNMLLTQGFYGYPTAEFGKYRAHPTGAFGTEDSAGNFARGTSVNALGNDGGVFVNGNFELPANNRLSTIPEAGMGDAGGSGVANTFNNIQQCGQLAHCPILGVTAAIGYKTVSSRHVLCIEHKTNAGGSSLFNATVPAFDTSNAVNPVMSICALPRGGFAASFAEGNGSTSDPYILLHSADGITFTDVTPTEAFANIGALYFNPLAR